MIKCPVCPKADIKAGVMICPQCGADLSAFLRVRELPDVYYNEGVELARQDLLNEAIIKLMIAVELNPNSIGSHIALGKILARMGRNDEAISHFDKVLCIDPDNSSANIEKRRIFDIHDNIDYNQNDMNDTEEIGSIIYATGVAFCIGGIIFAINAHLALQTASVAIAITGIGLLSMITGINLKSMCSLLYVKLGFVLALTGVILFYIHYPTNWYFPLLGYIILLYLIGILILIGNFYVKIIVSYESECKV